MQITRRLDLRIAVATAFACAGLIVLGLAYNARTLAYTDDEAAVREALLKSALSFEKNDIVMATKVWANDESLTVFESGHANYGWADYRDHHLVPEMGDMKNTKYAFSDVRVHLAGKTAWATSSTRSQRTFQITERCVTSMAAGLVRPCSNSATVAGKSCTGTRARHDARRLPPSLNDATR